MSADQPLMKQGEWRPELGLCVRWLRGMASDTCDRHCVAFPSTVPVGICGEPEGLRMSIGWVVAGVVVGSRSTAAGCSDLPQPTTNPRNSITLNMKQSRLLFDGMITLRESMRTG